MKTNRVMDRLHTPTEAARLPVWRRRRAVVAPAPRCVGAAGGGGGAAGALGAAGKVEAGDGASRMERGWPGPRESQARVSDRTKKTTASPAVARVRRFAVPRPVMKAPMPWDEPMPNPPPSLRWSSTTPIRARVTKRWIMSRTVVMERARGSGKRAAS